MGNSGLTIVYEAHNAGKVKHSLKCHISYNLICNITK